MKSEIRRELAAPWHEVMEKVPAALASEGFGVLTRIDMRETLAQKLGVTFRNYAILGACNPPLAHAALEAELEVGLMLPCNVIVYTSDAGTTNVVAINPMTTVAQDDPRLAPIAAEVRGKLARALARL